VSSSPSPRSDTMPHATWTVTAAGGVGMSVRSLVRGESSPAGAFFSDVYQIEAQHQPSPESLLLGAALEVGPAYHYFGAAAFAGSGWHGGRWFLEGNLGLGVEVLEGATKTTTVTDSSAGTTVESTIKDGAAPGLYLRGQGIAGVRLSRAFDLVAKLSVHLSSTGESGSFVSPTIGLRLRLL
jgi:hypothetical protein